MADTKSTRKPDWRNNVTWYTHETRFTRLAKAVVKPVIYSIGRVDCAGLENVPTHGPAILSANHFSLFDVLYLGVSVPRHPHYMAKKELYRNRLFGWTIRQFGSFPVYRGEADTWALEQAGRVLHDGSTLFMFPEGTRSKTAALKRGKAGVVMLALEFQAPIMPVAVWGTEKLKLGWKRTQVHISFGQPFDAVAAAGPPPYKHEAYRNVTTLMMKRIAAMMPAEYHGFYADSEA